jgi:PAS domain S-box-containing protein
VPDSNDFYLQSAFEAVGLGIIITDQHGCIQNINPRAQTLVKPFGRGAQGVSLSDLLPHTATVVARCLDAADGETCVDFEKNSDIRMQVACLWSGKTVTGAVITLHKTVKTVEADLSAVRARLDTCTRMNRQLTAIVDNSSDGIWVCDGKGTVMTVNKASERLNGIRAEEVIGKPVSIMEEQKIVDRNVTPEVIRTGRKVTTLQHIKRTGKYVLMTSTPVFDDNGQIILVVSNGRDMTYLNALNEELEQTRMKAKKLEDRLAEMDRHQLKDEEVVAENEKMAQVLRTAFKLAKMDASNILILGESGAGKGMLANFIHQNGNRAKKSFIQINCAALPETLLEAELFGYERGAFTGARQQGKAGLIELAHGGVLFLDEIGDMPLSVQAKLLKYLDDQQVRRVGGTQTRRVDCLIVAATNHDLKARVEEKAFRGDLYYRLNSFIIHIPPLRERPEDILKLADTFLKKYNKEFNLNRRLSYATLRFLQSHPFEGNVRELQNLMRRLVVMGEEDTPGHDAPETPVPDPINIESHPHDLLLSVQTDRDGKTRTLTEQLNFVEREILRRACAEFTSTRGMATHFGVSQPTIVRRLNKYNLSLKTL